jgi:hypothetical protein
MADARTYFSTFCILLPLNIHFVMDLLLIAEKYTLQKQIKNVRVINA